MHWLVAASSRAGLKAAAGLVLRPSIPIAEAWETVARVVGLSTDELAERIAGALDLRRANLDAGDRRSIRLIPEALARRFGVFPLRDDDRHVVVATANPMDVDAEQLIQFVAGRRVTFELAAPDSIARVLNAGYSPLLVVETVLGALGSSSAELVRVIEEEEPEFIAAVDVAAEPVVRLSSVILRDAIMQDASDIHIEPGTGGGTVRFRIDGMMRVYLRLPMSIVTRVVSRIKVLSRLDITNRVRPQDGRARINVDGRDFDLRVSTVPTSDSEKAVIRILRPQAEKTLDNVGIPPVEIARLRQLLSNRDGIVAITGPTGAGKTTTIYAAIREIAAREVNLVTVEDPVEYNIPGITQIQADSKRGLTFASALRSILRQDPDVIFVGEIRDLETAEIAVQAAMTGHLVLATVHANDAMGAVTRLHDLGLDMTSIGATFRGAVAQRLVRKLCPECAIEITGVLTEEEERLAAQYGIRPPRRAVGCSACANMGYRGRIPVAEVAITNAALAGHMLTSATIAVLQRAAISGGMRPLRQSGLARVLSGETTLQEVERVLGAGESIASPANLAEPAPAQSAAFAPTIRVHFTPPWSAPVLSLEAPEPVRADPIAEATREVARGRTPASPFFPARPPILLVEENLTERQSARAVLEDAGYDVVEANDMDAAIAALKGDQPFALMVADLVVAQYDGSSLIRVVRGYLAETLPILVLTAADDEQSERDLLDAGADDYLRGTVDPERFIARVDALLHRSASDAVNS